MPSLRGLHAARQDADVRLHMAGYSGTPLSKKLGITPSMTLVSIGAPKEYRSWLGDLPKGVRIVAKSVQRPRAVHLFVSGKAVLERQLEDLRKSLEPDGFVWVSWPKK